MPQRLRRMPPRQAAACDRELWKALRAGMAAMPNTKRINYGWIVQTRCGPLRVNDSPNESDLSSAPSAFGVSITTAFLEPARARAAGYDCNPFTGKWNWYTQQEIRACDVASFVADFLRAVHQLTEPTP